MGHRGSRRGSFPFGQRYTNSGRRFRSPIVRSAGDYIAGTWPVQWPVSRCSRHGCREADCNRVCSLAKKSHDTPPCQTGLDFPWRPFDRKSEEVVNAQGDSGGKNCEQCCAAATNAFASWMVRAMSHSLPPEQRPASLLLLTWRASPPGARERIETLAPHCFRTSRPPATSKRDNLERKDIPSNRKPEARRAN